MSMTRVAIGKKSGIAFDIIRAHDKGFIVLRNDGKEYLLPFHACKAVMHKRTYRAELEAEAGLTTPNLDTTPGAASYVNFDTGSGTLEGKLFFDLSENLHGQAVDRSGNVTPNYMNLVKTEALATLKKYFTQFRDANGIEVDTSATPWTMDDIKGIRFSQHRGGFVVDIGPRQAEGAAQNWAGEVTGGLKFVPPANLRTASAGNVAEAFVEGKDSDTAGDMKLLHGVIYSYAIPIGAHYKDKFYVNLTKYSKTTSVHQNALVDVLDRGNHSYKEVSEEDILKYAAKAFVENIQKYTFKKEESDWEEDGSASKASASASAPKSSKSSGSKGSASKSSGSGSKKALQDLLTAAMSDKTKAARLVNALLNSR